MINDILDDLDDLDQLSSPNQMQDENEDKQDIKIEIGTTNYSRLLTNNADKFLSHMNKINKLIDEKIEDGNISEDKKQSTRQNIQKSNQYALEITRENAAITKFIQNIYDNKFPELRTIVNNDAKYCRALLEIEQPNQQNKQPFSYLTPQQRISLRISISTARDPLPKEQQQQILNAVKVVMELSTHHDSLMMYLETCLQIVAPNLCQLVGSVVASTLIAAAGGIDKLAAMPACNIQVMGGSRASQIGFSEMERNHTGIFGQMDVVKDAPKKFQMKLVRMLATNTAKCARADFLATSNNTGSKLREVMYERFQKVQEEGGLMRTEKPMDIPDQQPKKKRGGKRHRRNKQLYQMSEMRKEQNRIKFGQEAEEQIGEGVGVGMLKAGIGKLKVQIKKHKLKSSKKMEQRMNKKSGLESSLNLNGHQGIELINPAANSQQRGTQSYFNREAGFQTVLNSKFNK